MLWDAICFGLEFQPRTYNITWAQAYLKCSNMQPANQKKKQNSVRAEPYNHPQSMTMGYNTSMKYDMDVGHNLCW